MSLLGKWRIPGSSPRTAMPDHVEDYPDMMEPAYILLEHNGTGEFAFGCVTGQIFAGGAGRAVEFSWQGNDEMDEVQGQGWAELQPDGSLNFHNGDEANFTARKWTSSTAC